MEAENGSGPPTYNDKIISSYTPLGFRWEPKIQRPKWRSYQLGLFWENARKVSKNKDNNKAFIVAFSHLVSLCVGVRVYVGVWMGMCVCGWMGV